MKLISMTEFVLNECKIRNKENAIINIYNYAQFLIQPLTLGMFIPCNEEGNVWKFPPTQEEWEWCKKDSTEAEQSFKQKEFYYQQSKNKVVFEGFELHNEKNVINREFGIVIVFDAIISILTEGNNGLGGFYKNDVTIEDLVILDLTLAENAIKQIGL